MAHISEKRRVLALSEGHADLLWYVKSGAAHQPRPGACSYSFPVSDNIRLSGESSRCAGVLEMAIRGEWRPVKVDQEWDRKSTAVLCQQLDCGSAVSESTLWDSPYRPVWWINLDCVHTGSALSDCAMATLYVDEDVSHKVICSGWTKQTIVLSLLTFRFHSCANQ